MLICASLLFQTLIESGSFTITLPDGRNLTANATHFVAVVIVPSTTMPLTTLATTTTTVAPTTKTDGLEPGAIAGIVVGCFVALALICILLYIFCFRKNTVRNPKVDVENNELKNTSGKFACEKYSSVFYEYHATSHNLRFFGINAITVSSYVDSLHF